MFIVRIYADHTLTNWTWVTDCIPQASIVSPAFWTILGDNQVGHCIPHEPGKPMYWWYDNGLQTAPPPAATAIPGDATASYRLVSYSDRSMRRLAWVEPHVSAETLSDPDLWSALGEDEVGHCVPYNSKLPQFWWFDNQLQSRPPIVPAASADRVQVEA